MANLDEIQIKISQDSSGASKAIDSLIDSLEKLSTKTDLGTSAQNIKSLGNSIRVLSKATESFNANNIAEQIGAIPEAMKSLGNLPVGEMEKFTSTIQTLSDVLEPLSQKAGSIATVLTALNQLPKPVQKAILENQKLEESNNKVANSFEKVATATMKSLGKIAGWGIGLGTIAKGLQTSLKLGTQYTQTVNMLNTVMGEGADEAKAFAENLGDVLGLNPADVMNFQATFQNLFVGFGNNSKQAQIMSKNLTQLSYDMSAFYAQLGGDPEAAAEKLRLAMAGTIEPIQRLGYAIKEADLQAVAARQGININVRNLNTASKSMLRYIAIMEQSTHVQGYMAKSFSSPATAMIVFKSAIKQLATEIGKTFLPMLMAAIPYMQAFVTGVLNMVKTINGILGIELPTINWDENKEGISGLGDEALETGKKIQKAFTLGIDELNVLDNSTADAGAGFEDITDLLKLSEYDMLEGFSGEKVKEIQERLKPLEGLFDGMARAFASFYKAIKDFADSKVYPWLVKIGDWMEENPETMEKLGSGLAYVALGLLLIKGVGALAKFLMIPELISGLKTAHEWLGKHNLGWKDIFKTMGYVFAGAIIIYGAYKLIDNIMNIILGIGDPFVNAREGAAGLAYIIGGALLVAFIAAGGWTLALAAGFAIAVGYMIDNWTDFSAATRDAFSATYKNLIDFSAKFQKKWAIFTSELKLNWKLAMNNMNGSMLKMLKDFVKSANPVVGLIMQVTGADEKIDEFIDKITLSEEEKDNEKDIKRDVLEDLMLELKAIEKANGMLTEATEKFEALSDAAYIAEKEKEEQTRRESESIAFSDKLSAVFTGELDKFTKEQTMEMKTGFEGIQTDIVEQISQEFSDFKIPEIATQTAETNTAILDNNELQTTTNELLQAANVLQQTENKENLSVIKSIGSDIISALRQVEDACRNIRINIHNHYGGGGDGYATGGYPTSGEYFFAREDGMPEMVGRVGRRTAVMNNGQIADTMAQSLIRAMGQGGGVSQPQVIENKLYLDGEVVYSNQQKIQRSKGYNLGMGVFANV